MTKTKRLVTTKRLLKTLHLKRGELYGISNGSRFVLAHCKPRVEIMEHLQQVNAVGIHGYNVKKRYITIVLCEEPELTCEVDAEFLQTVTRFELSADIRRKDGIFENIIFDHLAPTEIDLDGEWTFELIGQDALTKKLLTI